MIKVAINGFGRIGRLVFRIMEEDPEFEVVAINDLTDAEQLAHLLKYDTSHRNYRVDEISFSDNEIIVGNRKIKVYSKHIHLLYHGVNLELMKFLNVQVYLLIKKRLMHILKLELKK